MSLIRRSVDTYKGWPKWGRIAAPVTVAFIGIGALSGGAQDAETQKGQVEAEDSTTTTEAPGTTTTEAPATTTTEAPSTTTSQAPSTTVTTAKPVTTTTAKPAPPKPVTTTTTKPVTTTAPPTTAPPTTAPPTTAPPASEVYYANCDAARAAGVAPIYRGQPGYRAGLDRDNDGIACDA